MKALLFSRSLPRYAAARMAGAVVPGLGAAVGPLSLTDLDEPDLPGPGWHRVKPRLAGICGSDLATVDGRSSRFFEPIVSFPFVPGHEIVGDLEGPSGPSERGTQGPSGPSERGTQGPSGPSERGGQGPSGPSERGGQGPSGPSERGGQGPSGPSERGGSAPSPARVVIEPVLGCAARGINPPCRGCAEGRIDRCERVAFGHIEPGLQTGYCTDTGGGWSTAMVAHESQIHRVPDTMSDEAAVMVEPAACAIHGVMGTQAYGLTVLVLGAGTLGLCTVAALRRFTSPATLVVAAKHPEQQALARELGADMVVAPGETRRAVRRATGSLEVGEGLSGGVDVVVDCVGSQASVTEALGLVRPAGTVVLLGMPGQVSVDLTPLWQRQIVLKGSYAYGVEDTEPQPASPNGEGRRRTFELAFQLVAEAGLERLVSAAYPLDRYREAVEHAANAGRRGATKVVFDMRGEKRR